MQEYGTLNFFYVWNTVMHIVVVKWNIRLMSFAVRVWLGNVEMYFTNEVEMQMVMTQWHIWILHKYVLFQYSKEWICIIRRRKDGFEIEFEVLNQAMNYTNKIHSRHNLFDNCGNDTLRINQNYNKMIIIHIKKRNFLSSLSIIRYSKAWFNGAYFVFNSLTEYFSYSNYVNCKYALKCIRPLYWNGILSYHKSPVFFDLFNQVFLVIYC